MVRAKGGRCLEVDEIVLFTFPGRCFDFSQGLAFEESFEGIGLFPPFFADGGGLLHAVGIAELALGGTERLEVGSQFTLGIESDVVDNRVDPDIKDFAGIVSGSNGQAVVRLEFAILVSGGIGTLVRSDYSAKAGAWWQQSGWPFRQQRLLSSELACTGQDQKWTRS